MADKRISQLVDRGTIANNDVVPIVVSGATTTNKATISSIQTFMQGNLDLGVTSVGITLGSSGTDVSVSGSPITTSGNISINIPTASATNRGLLSSADWTTFNDERVPYTGATASVDLGEFLLYGSKLVANGVSSVSQSGSVLLKQSTNEASNTVGYTTISVSGSNSINFGVNQDASNSKNFSLSTTSLTSNVARTYTLPNASGTLALTSDLDGYVTLNTAQTITAQKVFNTSGSSDSVIITHGSGSGFALDVIKAGNNEAIRVTKTSGSGNAMTISGGNFEAGTIVKTGGTSSQFLMADGSVNTSVLPSGAYLPLTGGILTGNLTLTASPISIGAGNGLILNNPADTQYFQIYTSSSNELNFGYGGTTPIVARLGATGVLNLTGALNGTSASFSGYITGAGSNPGGLGGSKFVLDWLSGSMRVFSYGADASTNGGFVFNSQRSDGTNSQNFLSIASTGAATFSSSVTAKGILTLGESLVENGIINSPEGIYINADSDASGGTNDIVFGKGRTSTSGGTTFMTIKNSGNVGIGTPSPAYALDIQSGSGALGISLRGRASDDISLFTFFNNAANTQLAKFTAATTYFSTDVGGSERMRITSGGSVGIGTTDPFGLASSLVALSGNGNTYNFLNIRDTVDANNVIFIQFVNSSTSGIGSIRRVGTTNAVQYNTTSDYRLKEDLQEIKGLEVLSAIKVYNYKWKDHESRMDGVLAHELADVLPYAVSGEKDEVDIEGNEIMQGVDYSKIVPILIKAIQEQQEQIDSLKNQMQ